MLRRSCDRGTQGYFAVRPRSGSILIAIALIALCGMWSVCLAQTTITRVSGTVKDPNGAVLPGVKVTIVDVKSKDQKTVMTNDEGNFVITDVRAGTYILMAEHAGFKKTQVPNVVVHVDIPAVLEIPMETGGISETVSVTASDTQSLIRTEDARLSTTIEMKQVEDLPLNGRNPINLAGGAAGVNTNTNVRQSVINGMRGSFSNITWDGIEINDNLVRTDSLFGSAAPTVSGVAEFTLTTQNAGPDEGLGIAQVKLTTPRGGTGYHGSVYDFYRNSKFDANTFFNNNTIDPKTGKGQPKPALLQHQYGFTVGGPFALPRFGEGGAHFTQKKKLFFYFFYEKTNTTFDFTPLRTVLTAAARTGNFTYLASCTNTGTNICPAGISPGQAVTVNLLARAPGRTIDPRIQTLINLTPTPNNNDAGDTRNTAGFRFNTPNGSQQKIWGFRVDYDANSKNRIEVIFDRGTNLLPNDVQLNDIGEQFPGLPGGGQSSVRPRGSFAWHSNPTSTMTNEARFGFFRTTPTFINNEKFDVGYRLALAPATIPFTGAEYITNPIQNFLQQGRVPTNYDWIDNFSWVKGNHLLRFGGLYRAVRILNFNDGGTVPQFSVGFNTTTNPMPVANNTTNFPGGISSTEYTNATRLLGILTGAVNAGTQTFNVKDRTSGFTRGLGSRRHLNYDTLSFYGGDTWRFRSNLSLNFGLRWEYISPLTERDGLGLMPKDTSLAALNDPNALLDFAGSGTGRPFVAKDLNNFAPNVSFAWDPLKDSKTSIRGGFAISYAIDNNATVFQNSSVNGNAGLQSTFAPNTLTGTVSGTGIITLATPTFKVPRTLVDQLSLSQTPTLWTTEFHLKTPYAEQWNLGIEREVWKDTGLSVGYVGNRGVQLTRGIETNQPIIFQNGFFADFLRAQANLVLTGNPACTTAGCQTLTIFPKIGQGGNLGNAAIRTLISEGRVGELVSNYVSSRNTFLTIGTNGATIDTGFFLPANKNALSTRYVGSGAFSNYHALQAEIRKRLSHGYYYQINYTWSKALTDSEQAQTEFSALLDNTLGDVLEKKRISQDVTHVFKANAVYELPFGPGKTFFNSGGLSGKFLGGWQLSTILQIRSGRPVSFISARGTVNRNANSGNNTASSSLTIEQLKKMTGLFKDPVTGLPRLFDPALIAAVLANQTTPGNNTKLYNPAAGQFGNLALTPVSGPGYWNADLALIKKTRLTERMNLELRLEAFNVFNHTNFSVNEVGPVTGNNETSNINSANFGKITNTFDPRILQLAFKFNF